MNGGYWGQLCFSQLLRWNAVSVSKCWIKLITYCEQKTEQRFHFNLSKQFFHESLEWEEEWGKFTDTYAQYLKKISLTAVCFQGCTVLFLAVCAYVRSPFFYYKGMTCLCFFILSLWFDYFPWEHMGSSLWIVSLHLDRAGLHCCSCVCSPPQNLILYLHVRFTSSVALNLPGVLEFIIYFTSHFSCTIDFFSPYNMCLWCRLPVDFNLQYAGGCSYSHSFIANFATASAHFYFLVK